jgi:hypothetical protein
VAEENAIQGVLGKTPEESSVTHIHIVEARSVLSFRKHRVHRSGWIVYGTKSRMLAFVSIYAVDT